jgi:16S rRNA (cytosine967-C5)-methyltransferase
MSGALPAALIGHTQALVTEVFQFAWPADVVVSRYFKRFPALGHRDRGVVAEAVYAVLRQRLEFSSLAQSAPGPIDRRLALLGLAFVAGIPAVAERVGDAESQWLQRLQHVDRTALPYDVRCNLPEWLMDRLKRRFSDAEVEALAAALNTAAPLDLRVNSQKLTRDETIEILRLSGIAGEATRYSPDGIRIKEKPALNVLPIFKDGSIEVQDEGSQLLAQLVAPKRGELVIDFCAGAGGKTLALGALMRSTGRLYALDVSARRLSHFKPRLARSGLSNVHPMVIDSERDARLKRFVGKADRVLIDAPCSGLGTLRRNPDLKWRQNEASIAELALRQGDILESAARLVAPGGRLVYATCSLLDEENQAVVAKFLAAHPEFETLDAGEILASRGIAGLPGATLELWPHRHNTDGFFAVAMMRTKN